METKLALAPPSVDESKLMLNHMSELRLNNLKEKSKNLSQSDRAGLEKAARGFEAIFVNMMLKEMRNTKLNDENEENDGFGADTLKGYTDLMLAEQISKTGKGIGIAEMFYKQLTGENLNNITSTNGQIEKISGKKAENIVKDSGKSAENFIGRTKERIGSFGEIIKQASEKFGVPENLIKAVITAESAGKIDARSNAGAKGLMQLMDGTASEMGVDNPYDPVQNIMGGTGYLKKMLAQFEGNLNLALAAYNAGPGNVQKYNGVPPFQETMAYIRRVTNYMQKYDNESKVE